MQPPVPVAPGRVINLPQELPNHDSDTCEQIGSKLLRVSPPSWALGTTAELAFVLVVTCCSIDCLFPDFAFDCAIVSSIGTNQSYVDASLCKGAIERTTLATVAAMEDDECAERVRDDSSLPMEEACPSVRAPRFPS